MSKKWGGGGGGGAVHPHFQKWGGPSPTPVSGHLGYNRPHPLYCPQFLQDQHKIERISCPVEGGARITGVVYCGKLLY